MALHPQPHGPCSHGWSEGLGCPDSRAGDAAGPETGNRPAAPRLCAHPWLSSPEACGLWPGRNSRKCPLCPEEKPGAIQMQSHA